MRKTLANCYFLFVLRLNGFEFGAVDELKLQHTIGEQVQPTKEAQKLKLAEELREREPQREREVESKLVEFNQISNKLKLCAGLSLRLNARNKVNAIAVCFLFRSQISNR